MHRVYFDLNVISKIKRNDIEPYKTINAIVLSNDRFIFPYSPAHLKDLTKGYSDKTQTLVESDLIFIKLFSKDHCLYYDYKKKSVIPQTIDPLEYFNQLTNEKFGSFDLETIFSSEDSAIGPLWKSYVDLLKLLPSGIDSKHLENISPKYSGIKDAFPNLFRDNSYYSLLKDGMRVLSNPQEYGYLYKTIRNYAIEEMKINTDPSQWGNAFEYLDTVFKKHPAGSSFKEAIEKFINAKEPGTQFDHFNHHYLALDTLGYFRDEELPNLINDTGHAYYGAFCDFFITDDNNTLMKAKAVYEHFNIATQVCKSDEFLTRYFSLVGLGPKSQIYVLSSIKNILRNSLIVLDSINDEFDPATVYKIENPLLGYFNRLQVTRFQNYTSLSFYKKRDTYSNFMYWSEIEAVVNKTIVEFGMDDKLRSDFNEDVEVDELIDEKWIGRLWKRGDATIQLFYHNEIPGLFFRININN